MAFTARPADGLETYNREGSGSPGTSDSVRGYVKKALLPKVPEKVAALLGVSRSTIYREMSHWKLPSTKVGAHRLIMLKWAIDPKDALILAMRKDELHHWWGSDSQWLTFKAFLQAHN